MPNLTPEQEAAFVNAVKLSFIAGSASAGGSIGLKYAIDVNANNSAVTRGDAPKSEFWRLNDAAGAGIAGEGGLGFFAGVAAGTATGAIKLDFGTGKATKRSREPALTKLPRPYV